MKRHVRILLRITWVVLLSLVLWGCLRIPSDDSVKWFNGFDKLMHFGAYTLLYIGTWFAFPGAFWRWGFVGGLLLFGLLIETVQGFSGYRSADLADMLANASGIGFGCFLLFMAERGQMLGRYQALYRAVKNDD